MAPINRIASDILSLDRLHDDGVPTASIAILKDGKIESHVVTGGSENEDTVYQAASISKAICALAVARLVDDSKLSYETKVVDHLDSGLVDVIVGTSKEAREMMSRVNVRMLVSHTSGLSQHGFPGYGTDAIASPAEVIAGKSPANTPRMRFLSPPGAQCSYSGGGYTVLQLMLEGILHRPFSKIMHETLLQPLGMTRSWYGDLPAGEKNYTRAHFNAHAAAETQRGYNILPEQAAAALWTTPMDLLKAVLAIQNSLYTSSGFLKQSTAQQMLTKVASSSGLGNAGLGWWLNDVGFGHGGDNWPGYNCTLCGFHAGANGSRVVDEENPRNGIAIMTNSVLGHEMCMKQILAAVMYAQGWQGSYGKEDLWLPVARDGFVPYPAPADTLIDENWKTWIGKWEGGWEIMEQGNSTPALKFKESPAIRLLPAAAPVKTFGESRKEIWLVAEGLSIGARLTWDDDRKGEEVVKLKLEDGQVLKRLKQ